MCCGSWPAEPKRLRAKSSATRSYSATETSLRGLSCGSVRCHVRGLMYPSLHRTKSVFGGHCGIAPKTCGTRRARQQSTHLGLSANMCVFSKLCHDVSVTSCCRVLKRYVLPSSALCRIACEGPQRPQKQLLAWKRWQGHDCSIARPSGSCVTKTDSMVTTAHQTSWQRRSHRWYDLANACGAQHIEFDLSERSSVRPLRCRRGDEGVGRTIFCCHRLDGCDVFQRISELLAGGMERRRLANVRNPATLPFPEIVDSRLVLQRRGWHVQWAGSCQTLLELRSAVQWLRMSTSLVC